MTVIQLIGCRIISKLMTSMGYAAAARFCCTIRVTTPITVNPIATMRTTVIQLAGVQEITDSFTVTGTSSLREYQSTKYVSRPKKRAYPVSR
jgi:hypothetical protein